MINLKMTSIVFLYLLYFHFLDLYKDDISLLDPKKTLAYQIQRRHQLIRSKDDISLLDPKKTLAYQIQRRHQLIRSKDENQENLRLLGKKKYSQHFCSHRQHFRMSEQKFWLLNEKTNKKGTTLFLLCAMCNAE